jgi:hypothetical protein
MSPNTTRLLASTTQAPLTPAEIWGRVSQLTAILPILPTVLSVGHPDPVPVKQPLLSVSLLQIHLYLDLQGLENLLALRP